MRHRFSQSDAIASVPVMDHSAGSEQGIGSRANPPKGGATGQTVVPVVKGTVNQIKYHSCQATPKYERLINRIWKLECLCKLQLTGTATRWRACVRFLNNIFPGSGSVQNFVINMCIIYKMLDCLFIGQYSLRFKHLCKKGCHSGLMGAPDRGEPDKDCL